MVGGWGPVKTFLISFTDEETEAQRHRGISPGSESLSVTVSLSHLQGTECLLPSDPEGRGLCSVHLSRAKVLQFLNYCEGYEGR